MILGIKYNIYKNRVEITLAIKMKCDNMIYILELNTNLNIPYINTGGVNLYFAHKLCIYSKCH